MKSCGKGSAMKRGADRQQVGDANEQSKSERRKRTEELAKMRLTEKHRISKKL